MRRRALVAVAVLAGSLGLSACAGADQQGSLSHRVATWASGTGYGQTVGTLLADNRSVDGVIALRRGTGAIHTACGVLETDSANAYSNLPTPDEQLTQEVELASTREAQAGADCYNGGGTNLSLMRKSARERAQGAAALVASVRLIERLTHRVLSTTTTTQPGGGGVI
jgi:hypothetical protein